MVDFQCHVIFTCLRTSVYNKTEAMYEVSPGSTFTFTRGLLHNAFILFTRQWKTTPTENITVESRTS